MIIKSYCVSFFVFIFKTSSTLAHGEIFEEFEDVRLGTSDEKPPPDFQEFATVPVLNKQNTKHLKRLIYTQEILLDGGDQEVASSDEYVSPVLQMTENEEVQYLDEMAKESTKEREEKMSSETFTPIQMEDKLPSDQQFQPSNKAYSSKYQNGRLVFPDTLTDLHVNSNEQTTTILMKPNTIFMQGIAKSLPFRDNNVNNDIVKVQPHHDHQSHKDYSKEDRKVGHFKLMVNHKKPNIKPRKFRHKLSEAFKKVISEDSNDKTILPSRDNLNDIIAHEITRMIRNKSKNPEPSPSCTRVSEEKIWYKYKKNSLENNQKLQNSDDTSSNIESSHVNICFNNRSQTIENIVPYTQNLQNRNNKSSNEQKNKKAHSARVVVESSLKELSQETSVNENIDKNEDRYEKNIIRQAKNPNGLGKSLSNLLTYFKDFINQEEAILSKLRTVNEKGFSPEQKTVKSKNQINSTKAGKSLKYTKLLISSEKHETLSNEKQSTFDSFEQRNSRYSDHTIKYHLKKKPGEKILNKNLQELKKKHQDRRTSPSLQRPVLPTQENHEPNQYIFHKEMQELADSTKSLFGNIVTFCKSILDLNSMGMTTSERVKIEKLKNMILLGQIPIGKFASVR